MKRQLSLKKSAKSACSLLAFLIMSMPIAVQAQDRPQDILLNGQAGGAKFDGIGVVEGGGGTGVLLKDYPEPQRSQIMDLVFKPKFGASVSALYVEIPGDGNSTQGSMPSHMHSRGDLNYQRGYIWWEMAEAKKRNPAMSFDGAAWSAPAWVGEKSGGSFWSQDTADYYVSWLKGLRNEYGIEMDALGLRNEKGEDPNFAKMLRKSLNANGFSSVRLHGYDNWPNDKLNFVAKLEGDPELRDALDIISAHNNLPEGITSLSVIEGAARMNKPLWNTEQHVYKGGFDGLITTVQSFNLNYVKNRYTRVTDWYGIAGLYTMEPYSGEKEATVRANWPWSGHYEVNPKLWAYAHYGQFSSIGWTYLNYASGELSQGGSFVTLVSPQKDYSVIIETKDATAPQTVRLTVGGGLSSAPLAVWLSTETEQFIRQADLSAEDGIITVTLQPHAVYTLTTTRGQQKGGFADVPQPTAFPFPYSDNFDAYRQPERWGYLPRYFADISGAFELSACPKRPGQCLRQSMPEPPLSWSPDWLPYTIIGDDQWTDYTVSADLYLEAGETAAVLGRINNVGSGYGVIPKGYILRMTGSGDLVLSVIRGKMDKKELVGDAEQQAMIKAGIDTGDGGEKLLGTAHLTTAAGSWHSIKLRFAGQQIIAIVDGKTMITATDTTYKTGMAGLLAGHTGDHVSRPFFDNFAVAPNGSRSFPRQTALKAKPMYE